MLWSLGAKAQVEVVKTPFSWLNVRNDKRYIEDHTKDLTIRFFGTNKFSGYVIGHNGNAEKLPYSSNDYVNLGLGFSWRFIGMNLGFKIPFQDNDRFGRTKTFDLQSFLYFRKLQLDIYAQAHNGLHVSQPGKLYRLEDENVFPYREDMRTRNFGVNGQYIFNNRRFSYRAAFLQNEYQKKSAGSFMLGGSLYYFRAAGDSAIIPSDVIYGAPFWRENFDRTNVISLSVNAGYAYTLVLYRHFFITGSIAAGPGINYTNRRGGSPDRMDAGIDYQLNGTLRVAVGYNSPEYFAGLQYIRLTNRNGMAAPAGWQQFETGSLRVTLARRIKLNKKMESRVLKSIEDVADEVEEVIR